MVYTADYIFEHVMHMHDEGDEATGKYDTQDNKEYKNRMLPLLNQRLSELWQYTTPTKQGAPGSRATVTRVNSWDDEIELDDFCEDVLAFGVAALMFNTEDTVAANYYQQEYERLLQVLMSGRGITSEPEAIEDVYSGTYRDANGDLHYATGWFPHNHFSEWG